MSNIIVIKLGGSVLSREDCAFDYGYVAKLKDILTPQIELGKKFCIITGGGYTCRMYQRLAKESGIVNSDSELHWIGTTVNVLHAELVRAAFADVAVARPIMYEDYYSDKHVELEKPVLLGGGGRPGHSGDMDAILLALKVGATTIVSLKNIDYLYTADPKKNPDAEIVKQTNWEGYFDILGTNTVHEPGGNYIVDPASAHKAKEHNIKFVVLKGTELDNFNNYLEGKEFVGSTIS